MEEKIILSETGVRLVPEDLAKRADLIRKKLDDFGRSTLERCSSEEVMIRKIAGDEFSLFKDYISYLKKTKTRVEKGLYKEDGLVVEIKE